MKKLLRAKELFLNIYPGSHSADDVKRAPRGSQLGDWRDGLALLDESIADLGDSSERDIAAKALHDHIESCETCSGPDDGCETGKELEWECIDRLSFDPYDGRYRNTSERTDDMTGLAEEIISRLGQTNGHLNRREMLRGYLLRARRDSNGLGVRGK